ncbi:cytochrome P450 [Coprinopsis sp. MPI-PUGE-AT-0042]|nr:cytochrome P450 [Coprinopsis sp. MPI-PUGE-AT-0042]
MLEVLLHTQTLGWLLAIGALTFITLAVLRGRRSARGLPLPPGPKGLPLLGNIFQIPSEKPWEVYNEWRKVYGDIIYLEAPGQPLLILNNLEDCLVLLEKRGANYSDRLQSMGTKLMNLSVWSWGFENYGPRLKEYRRVFHQLLSPQANPAISACDGRRGPSLPSAPPLNTCGLCRPSSLALLSYESHMVPQILELNKARISNIEHLVDSFLVLLRPGRLLVDFIPALRFVPAWFPGAGWKREIDRVRVLADQVTNIPCD